MSETRIEVGKPMPQDCPACGAIPVSSYCNLTGCPMRSPDPVVSEEEVFAAAKAWFMEDKGPYVHEGHRAFAEDIWDRFPLPDYLRNARACLTAALKVRTGK